MNAASATFQNNVYRAAQANRIYQPHRDSFPFIPSVPISGIDYYGGIGNSSQNGG